ncbi:MAG: trypsin-like peptidase domain-containing protein [Puniceicoccales bacterium]|jgi:S1-C subfamily serine protease|nr:trypsin-like peptidase domain-containing protein [Puniceicoccales bacterium]
MFMVSVSFLIFLIGETLTQLCSSTLALAASTSMVTAIPQETVAAIPNSNIAPNVNTQPNPSDTTLPNSGYPSSTLCALSNDMQHLWNLRKDSVVKVMGIENGNSDKAQEIFCTGFFADHEGHVLTTATITTRAETLWIEYQRLCYMAILVGKDTATNLAVIKLIKKPEQLTPILLSKAQDIPIFSEGHLVMAIGCALGMEPTPTWGMITGQNIVFEDHIFVTTYLRSNINIYGGESGAPVFGSNGDLCGILIASLPELHSSLIIPKRALERIFNDIVHNKGVKYCTAGFSVRARMSAPGKKEFLISAIDEQKIKCLGTEILKVGDIIRMIEKRPIEKEGDIADILFFKHPNEPLSITVLRNEKPLTVTIILSEKKI